MNRSQFARQVQALLRALTWSDGGLVFARESVLISLGTNEDIVTEKVLPLAVIRPGQATPDPDHGERPDLVEIDLSVSLIVANAQDQYGETALVGANRAGGSDGRGLFEVEEKVLETLFQIGPASGMPIIFRGAQHPEPAMHPTLGYIAYGAYNFKGRGTVLRTYEAPTGLAGTAGGGTVALTWNTPTRFDHRRFVLRRASGTTPPSSTSGGTGVTLGGSPDGAGVTSKTDSPGAGTWSYSLFAIYDDEDAGADGMASLAQSWTGTA